MKAIFLDRGTFADSINISLPTHVSTLDIFESTPANDEEIISRCLDYDIIITNKVVLNRYILGKLPKLKLIQLTATGMNNVDASACKEFGISLFNVAGYAVKSVPEHTFMLMLNAMRASKYYHNKITDQTWANSGKFCLLDEPLYDLEDKTIGIIGAGTIGNRVAQIAKAFGMTVLLAERKGTPIRNLEYTEFETVLAQSDIITLHCPLTPDTKHLINEDTIKKMQKKPLIVNVARGGVVDTSAIVKAIHENTVFGYASDVFETEPMSKYDETSQALLQLAEHPRVFLSPHNAWGSLSAQQTLWNMAVQQIETFVLSD